MIEDISLSNDKAFAYSLLNKFKSTSKYLPYWESLKESKELIIIENKLILHEPIKKGIRNLRRLDNYFKEHCIFIYGCELLIESKSLNNKIHLRLYKKELKLLNRYK